MKEWDFKIFRQRITLDPYISKPKIVNPARATRRARFITGNWMLNKYDGLDVCVQCWCKARLVKNGKKIKDSYS